MQKAKGNHHKMSKTHEGSVGVENKTPIADVENNSENPSALKRMGRAAVEAVKGIVRVATNRNGFAERLGINTKKATGVDVDSAAAEGVLSSDSSAGDGEKGSREGSSNGLTPKQIEALEKYARVVVIPTPEKQTSDSTKDASGSSAEKNIPVSEPPEPTSDELARIKWNDEMRDAAAKRSVLVHPTAEEDLRKLESFGVDIDSSSVKPSTPEKPVDVSENEPKYYSLDDLIYEDVPKSEADEILKNAYGTAHEPKTLDELIDNPNIPKEEADEILDRVYGSSSEKNDREDDVNSAKSDQESGAAESSKDEQVKDSNSDTGEVPVKEISPEEHKVATDLKVARMRYVKASVKYETRFFKENFGGEERRKKLDAAAEELKRCELEYMRFQFSEKIEAVKQGSEEDQAKLAEEIAHAVFEDMQRVSREIKEAYSEKLDSQSPIRKVLSKLGKWINKGGKISQTVKQGGAGLVGGAIVGSVATWPITTAVGLAAGVGVANLAKLGVLEDRRDKDVLSEIPIERLRKLFRDDVKGMDVGDVIDHTVGESIGELHNASVERQGYLRKRMRWAMGRFGIGFALGGYAGKFIGDWANSAHATGAESNTATPAQSGSEQTPQSSGSKHLIDNPAAKTIGNSVNPDAPNFSSYDYPWNWAAEKFGDANAMDQLHNLADKAMANGHTVEWYNTGGIEYLEVDGSSVTADVLGVLNQYV